MQITDMKVGKPLEIYINREGYHYRVVSKIEDVGEGRVCVSLIASKTRVFEFEPTDVVDIVYREEDRMWKWKSVQGSVVTLDDEQFHAFTTDEPAESYNRRNAYRVYIGEKMILHYMVHDLKKLREFNDSDMLHSQTVFNYDSAADILKEDCFRYVDCDAFVKDISEVGAGIYSNQKLEKGDELAFEFQTDFGEVSCRAEVVRRLDSHQSSFLYYYGCRFTETSRNLSKYIYEKQREQLRKARDSRR